MYINAQCRFVKYWLKLVNMFQQRIPRKAYDMLMYYDNCGYENYASSVRNLLFSYGFGHVWLFQGVGDAFAFVFKDI